MVGFGFQWRIRFVGVIHVMEGEGLPSNEHSSNASEPSP
jgi:hypothetical protein